MSAMSVGNPQYILAAAYLNQLLVVSILQYSVCLGPIPSVRLFPVVPINNRAASVIEVTERSPIYPEPSSLPENDDCL